MTKKTTQDFQSGLIRRGEKGMARKQYDLNDQGSILLQSFFCQFPTSKTCWGYTLLLMFDNDDF